MLIHPDGVEFNASKNFLASCAVCQTIVACILLNAAKTKVEFTGKNLKGNPHKINLHGLSVAKFTL